MGGRVNKALRCLHWLPVYGYQWLMRRPRRSDVVHLVMAVADHFEPSIMPGSPETYASVDEQERRLEWWCSEYPKAVGRWRDADGRPLRHTYFYPAEQYNKTLIDRLAEHCRSGWGEIEIHLHHGVDAADTAENTRRVLLEFRDNLAQLGCLSRWNSEGPPRYAFVHGNWALANSAGGRDCGVDEEMAILAETGCYADLTLPSAPHPAQVTKINALYECALPLHEPAPHRKGRDLRSGEPPRIFPLVIQGPLGLDFARWVGRWPVPLENGELTTLHPATMHRLGLWCRPAITVIGRPDWLFIKLHCHGMNPRDKETMLGAPMQQFLGELTMDAPGYRVHFVTAREMVNIILAACDGREGDPGTYRDYRLRLSGPMQRA
jgi:hypothetical protein